jgi:hypothetical protein
LAVCFAKLSQEAKKEELVASFVEMHAPLSAVVVRREITRLFTKKSVNGLRQVSYCFILVIWDLQ